MSGVLFEISQTISRDKKGVKTAKKPPKIRPQKKGADRHRPRFTQVKFFVYDLFHFPKKSVGILSIPAFFICAKKQLL